MAARTLPGIGLTGFWDLGANGWKDGPSGGMDENLRRLSALTQLTVLDIVESLPGSPSDGQIYLVSTGVDANSIAVRDNGSWVMLAPQVGWRAYNVTDGKTHLFNGTAWVEFGGAGGGAGGLVVQRQVFTSSGTWTKPAGLLYVDVEGVAGGGSGYRAGNVSALAGLGGSAGGWFKKIIAEETLGATEAVTVGNGGSLGASSSASNGASGGTSSFGSHCSANGGAGGTLAVPGSSGGSATGGDVNISGGKGHCATTTTCGHGAASYYGGGGLGGNSSNAGQAGSARGSGGGASNNNNAPGAGAAGIVIVTEYIAGA